MMMCSLSVIFTVLVLNFHSRRPETHEMPDFVRRGVCQWLAWLLRMERPGHDLTRKGMLGINRELSKFEQFSSKSLLANVLDIDDDIRSIMGGGSYTARIVTPRKLSSTTTDQEFETPNFQTLTHRRHSQIYSEARSELQQILHELRVITNKLREEQTKQEEASDWQFAAMVVDRLCLYVFILFSVVSTTSILLSAPSIFLD